jgi:hypothetical protein
MVIKNLGLWRGHQKLLQNSPGSRADGYQARPACREGNELVRNKSFDRVYLRRAWPVALEFGHFTGPPARMPLTMAEGPAVNCPAR